VSKVSDKDVALQRLLDVVTNPNSVEWARQLAMQWPSLAAALGDFIAAHEYGVPRPLRAAANLVREELGKPPVATVAEPNTSRGLGGWCFCSARKHPHLHDGTMPGRPVIDDE
jgi:hypothetical protein